MGIVARIDRKEALDYAAKLATYIEGRGLKVSLEPTLAKHAGRNELATSLEDMNVDLIVTVGGDGTILKTCLATPKPEPPILPINMGVRGFLTEVDPKEGIEAIDKCLAGEFKLEVFRKVACRVGREELPHALNEVYITSRTPAKMLYVEIFKDGEAVGFCRADGFVVASKAGATGYSLSGGGPILDPAIDAFVLTPICPLTLFYPIVFSNDSLVEIKLMKTQKAVIVVDGDFTYELDGEESVEVTGSRYTTRFVRLKTDFYGRLRRRLLVSRGQNV
ncbi:NAD(+)/NADH kinase [Candidatus Bathyarchaeota archaeon]|nr:NAD(+)/NADH kinase [Candidatus Bathyarchaeota archaeon]